MKPPSTRSRSLYATVTIPKECSDSYGVSETRAKAMRSFENYLWQDDYFDDSKQDMIAVFDHRDSGVMALQAGIMWILLGWSLLPTILLLILRPDSKILYDLFTLQLLSLFVSTPVVFIIALVIVPCFPSRCRSLYPPAHTGVTSDGLIHKPARGLWGYQESK